jgi:hypothetical protein
VSDWRKRQGRLRRQKSGGEAALFISFLPKPRALRFVIVIIEEILIHSSK